MMYRLLGVSTSGFYDLLERAPSARSRSNAGLLIRIRESFALSQLKKERVYRATYPTRDAVRADTFDYIEAFYNSRRRHSTLGRVSPIEFERSHAGLA
jgi:transposase InsO family protein